MDISKWWCHSTIKLLLLINLAFAQTRILLQTLKGEVGAGNFTYFKLTKEGPIQLVVKTLEGDADIYVSDSTSKPTFKNYDIQSTTYGDEVIDIPSSSKRPVAVGIYGHPFSDLTLFQMDIYWLFTEDSDKEMYSHYSGLPSFSEEHSEDEESLLWTIIINFLKILLEVLF
ncbi:hypothetical protein BSL78_17265 [Apostichopus japonicus]|uniref:Uncharacterized protein n=1 Tax=Stichopus japonicus TaxID=307972 RepID=A0A2G8KCY9_STIJA|nr:hypothetical protein BSL78_17265 [Apostichopus japonicus]